MELSCPSKYFPYCCNHLNIDWLWGNQVLKRQQSVLGKQKLTTSLPPYNMTHISHYPTFNIWWAVRELPVIMFEIRLYCFRNAKSWVGSNGACFRNICYPIKMGAGESNNYLLPVFGMMNGIKSLFREFSPTRIYLWCAGGLHLSSPAAPRPSSDYKSTSESRRVLGWVMAWVSESV